MLFTIYFSNFYIVVGENNLLTGMQTPIIVKKSGKLHEKINTDMDLAYSIRRLS
jgi:hypothetical protein